MIQIEQEKCIGCGMCAADCLAMNIEVKDKKANVKKECLECGHCVSVCPVNAVSILGYDMDDVEEYNEDTFKVDPENLLHAIKFRRSTRFYKPEKVSKEDLEMLLQAGRYTATAKNNQGCNFVFVQEERDELKERVWNFVDEKVKREGRHIAREFIPFVAFNRRRKANPEDDYLFRNAPVVLFITSEWPLDAGLAAQNMETMANAMGMGVLFNGYLARLADANEDLKKWLGIEGQEIKACLLLGYPDRKYKRTAPRKEANVIWK
ncbi:MAG: nitroreductase family protein [Dorea sp.]